MKDRGDNSERNKLKGVGWLMGAENERGGDKGRDIEGKTDGGMRQRGLPADKIAVCDRFLWRLNWAHGLRGISLRSE